jgi:hypothetical protein
MTMRTAIVAASAAALLTLAGCKTGGMKVASAGRSVAGAASLIDAGLSNPPGDFAVQLHLE